MKHNIISIFAVGALVMSTACSPDEYKMPNSVVTSAELVEGIAYSVTPDPANPNHIICTSLVSGVVPVWNTPNGYSESKTVTLDLPFAGEYPIQFGVVNGSGVVWGEPYTLVVTQNDFSMLSDEIWTNLAGGVDENGNGKPKTWVVMDKVYGTYHGSAPVGYMNPDDVKNDGTGLTDLMIGTANWNMNWDPGFQSWLIDKDNPYMKSSMTLSLDPVKGCVAEINRHDSTGESTVVGGFTLNVSDPKRPLISFNGCEMLHAEWGDGVCDNYVKDIKIIECTPYVLQFATMRTNSEGPWWIVWNFVAKDVQDGTVTIPTGEPELLPTAPVVLPEYADLKTDLFTISGSDATYVASQTTYLLNDETPYDLIWWNPATATWDWIIDGNYNETWAPAFADEDFALTLSDTGKMEFEGAAGAQTANFTLTENSIVFDKEVTLLTAGGHALKGIEFTVLKCNADNDEVVLGVPVEKDAAGDYNKYLCARMTIKPIGGGQTGPTVIPVNNANVQVVFGDGIKDRLRFQLYNPWGSGEWPVDITKLKLKKNQVMTLKFKVLSGIEWNAGAAPKMAFLENNIVNLFENSEPTSIWDTEFAVPFNTTSGAEQTVTLTNTTGTTVKFEGTSMLGVAIQNEGLATVAETEDGNPDVKIEVISLTIE